ncbi:MAG: transcription-repair coupling factor [Deltaproteobacteria bacterium]|nr:transcription-repair coupling factor [Deltaproteobacteria bacterium]
MSEPEPEATITVPPSFEALIEQLAAPELPRVDLVHAQGGALGLVLAELARRPGPPWVVVAPDADEARRLVADTSFFLGDGDADGAEDGQGQVLLLPAPEASPFLDVAPDRRTAMARLATLFHLSQGLPWRVLVVPAAALARRFVPKGALSPRCDLLQAGELVDRDAVLQGLAEGGYLRVPVVEDPGPFAARGAVLDLWPPSSRWPARVELDEELCVAIRLFDPDGQRTVRSVPELFLHPVREALLGEPEKALARRRVRDLADEANTPSTQLARLLDDVDSGRAFFGAESFVPAYYPSLEPLTAYLPARFNVLWDRPARAVAALDEDLARAARDREARVERAQPTFPLAAHYLRREEVLQGLAAQRAVVSHEVVVQGTSDDPATGLELCPGDALDLGARSLDALAAEIKTARSERGKVDALVPLLARCARWLEDGQRVLLAGRTPTQAERLATLLRSHDRAVQLHVGTFDPAALGPERRPESPCLEVFTGEVARGFELPSRALVVITEEVVFGARARRSARRKGEGDSARAFLDDLRALAVGDHVVHIDHGIARYNGLQHRQVGASALDFLVLEYADRQTLLLPVTRLNQLQKYSGGEGAPRLDRLGGQTFAKSKARVQREVRQLADELLRLYAERRASPGRSFPPPGMLYQEFEATFPFEETPDQARAIEDVLRDLQTPTPMDRLVCGDVGFGKTEVALRAAFHVASQGAQVAVLCPTTVLAQQHFNTFAERLRSYALELAVLSRFASPQEQRDTLRRLKEGRVDVVVGTHRLLSRDVHFKDLGLLVVDEEQRFGVTHKERIKQLRAQLDVLTLSATPIPRTLQMAVAGLRDLSLITTAPVDRRAVRTIVSREDPQLLREAVARELSRGGQVFYVYNRVDGLYERADRLQKLLPSARVAVAHGQLPPDALETVMLDFIEGRYDVLCATAIIESGLDIPRANTMLLDRADLLGLSQLYQLRGRVGRSRERAWCYLFVPPPSRMTDEARTRIEALERFTELGSGFKVASLDLELRGAGDLLGAEQSGMVSAVGFDLYCQLLEEAVAELRGHPVARAEDPELTFDEPSYLPEEYIEDVGVRLSVYKRLAGAADEDEVHDLASELEDRFGPAPAPARVLVRVMALKTRLRRLRALGVEASRERVVLHLREDSPLDGAKVLELCAGRRALYRLTPDMKLTRRFGEGDGVTNAEAVLKDLEPLVLG